MKTLAIIPARGGSKGVPRKNICVVAGKPLIAYSIEEALKVSGIDRVCVSTEDQEIAHISRQLGAEVLERPISLAGDDVATRDVLCFHVEQMAREGYYPDAVVTLQPTSPLRRAVDIEKALELFSQYPNADSLVSCVKVPHHFHPLSVMRENDEGYLVPFINQEKMVLRRQDKPQVFARNGAAIYITRTSKISEYIFGGNLLPYFMSEKYSLDVDSLDDLREAENLLSEVRDKE